MINEDNPYVGPRAFQSGEKKKFYGRDREARELVDLLIAERIVLLYSLSGAGKTSLVQAAVIPAMRDEDYQVLPIVRPGLIEGAANIAAKGNPFVSRLINGCEEGKPNDEAPLSDISGITLASYFAQRAWIQVDPRLKLLVLDQFEEVLNSGEAEETKLEFFQQLGDALKDQQIWTLFAMREESSAALDGYRHLLPTRLSTRFRLVLLTRSKVDEAIRIPADLAGVTFQDDAVRCLLDDLSTVHERASDGSEVTRQVGFIEPLYLQIVCQRLWGQLPYGTTNIRPEDLGHTGCPEGGNGGASEVEQALEYYYDSTISSTSDKTHASQRSIREWIEQELITPQGLRRQVPLGEKETAGLSNKVVEALESHALVRRDLRSGTPWFEITHDRLAAVILYSNASWFSRNLEPFQVRAMQWSKLRRAGAEQAAEAEILRGRELSQALKWKKQHPSEVLTDVDRRYLQYCEEVWDRGKLVRRAKWGFCLVIIPGVLIAGWIMAYQQQVRANAEAQLKKVAENYNQKLETQSVEERARLLLSAAATNKWRTHNHELASLLALHAHRLIERHGGRNGLGAWGEEILRASLQSKPFAFSENFGGDQAGIANLEPALSGSLAIATVAQNAQELNITSLTAPSMSTKKLKPARLIHADFSPEGRYLTALVSHGAMVYSVLDDEHEPILIKTQTSPAGPFCMSPDETTLALATSSGSIEVWRLSPDGRSAKWGKTFTSEQLQVPRDSIISALACGAHDSWLAWGTSAGHVGYVDMSRLEPNPLWIAKNDVDNWPNSLKEALRFRKATLEYSVAAIRYLPNRRWLLVFYRDGPPQTFDLVEPRCQPPSAYLLLNEYSQASLQVAQEQGLAVRRVANLIQVFRADVSRDENKVLMGGGSRSSGNGI